jgi:hypothetical protein
MKALLSIFLVVAATLAWAAEKSAPISPVTTIVKGEVLEVKDVESYTYLRLMTKDGEAWAAVSRASVKKGDKVMVENVTVMNNFESKSLKRTFPTIVFGSLARSGDSAQSSGNAVANAGKAKIPDVADIHVPKATGTDARTVAEVITKVAELKDRLVLVRGKIVKYNPGIMGKNWIHLRDGSGSSADQTNDVLVTTMGEAKTGDVVTVKGIVRADKDFGSGYSYKVIIEDATFQQ